MEGTCAEVQKTVPPQRSDQTAYIISTGSVISRWCIMYNHVGYWAWGSYLMSLCFSRPAGAGHPQQPRQQPPGLTQKGEFSVFAARAGFPYQISANQHLSG